MAQKLADTATYLRSFVDGQGGGAVNYTAYPTDFDNNFLAIENTVDAVIDEVNLLSGQNSPLITDLITSTSPAVSVGVMGAHSYDASLVTGDTTIRIQAGSALASVGRVSKTSTDDHLGSGSTGTRWVALQSTGLTTLETAAAQGLLDLWTATFTSGTGQFTVLTRVATVLPDGDYFQDLLTNIVIDSTDFLDLPGQARVRAVDTTFTIASNDTLDDIEFTDADTFDVGTMHDPGGTAENFTIPTGGDGIYQIVAQTTFDESTAAGGGTAHMGTLRQLQIDLAGTVVARFQMAPLASPDDNFLNVHAIVSATAADVIKAQVLQDAGGTMAVINSSMTIAKIA